MSSTYKQFAACVFYGCASGGLSFINKNLFLLYNYKFPSMVLFIQILLAQFTFGVIFTSLFKIFKPEGIPKIWSVPEFSLTKAKNCWILSLTFLANTMAGIYALTKVNIPCFLAFRKLSTLFLFITDVFVLKKKINLYETAGVMFITIGALLCGVIFI